MDSKDVEEIFKGVLTDESQESQEASHFSNNDLSMGQSTPMQPGMTSPSLAATGKFDLSSYYFLMPY
jgi:hypothetical protein